LISNLSPEQQAERADPMNVLLLNPYELPPVYLDGARTGELRTGSAKDSYGSLRSRILPVKAATGNTVLYVADMDIAVVEAPLSKALRTSTTIGMFVLFGTLIFVRVYSASLVREGGGGRRELSLLMTDVIDFTTISEQLEPERLMVSMSEYFDRVVAPILKNQGALDKYVGDAIFSYWNAPQAQSNHAMLCRRAALDARAASKA
jgi:hypothetical protein